MKSRYHIIVVLFLFSIFACGNQYSSDSFMGSAGYESIASSDDMIRANPQKQVEQKIITEGSLQFETQSVINTNEFVKTLVAHNNGYITSENAYNYSHKIEYTLSVHIPADSFAVVVNTLSEHALSVTNKNIYSRDVTEDYIDVTARLSTKKQLEKRYVQLLQEAKKVEEILAIEKELGTIRSDIESFEGRLRYLENRVSYSVLTISFYEKTSTVFGFSSKMGQAIKNGWTNLLWFFVGITSLWPFVVLGIGVIFLFAYIKKKKPKKIKQKNKKV